MSDDEVAQLQEAALRVLRGHRVSRTNPEPLYLQASRAIEAITGMYAGAQASLPGEFDMAAALGIGRPTLRQAISHLVQAGRLYTKRGVGTFVAPAILSRPARLTSLHDDLAAQGEAPSTKVLSLEQRVADDDVTADLGIAAGSELTRLCRIRYAGDQPLAVIENWLALPGELLPGELEGKGLYATLREKFDIEPAVASLRVSARVATKEERGWLDLRHPSAVLVARRTTFDMNGSGIEVGTTVYTDGAAIDGIRLQP